MSFKHRINTISFTALLTVGVLPVAVALAPPTPGAIQDSLKQQKRHKNNQQPVVTQSPNKRSQKVKSGGKKIKVKQFIIAGNQQFSEAELHQLIREQEHQALTLEEVYAVANSLTKFYREQGYSLASVTVPAQKVAGGRIRLQVSEGIIDKITFSGNKTYSDTFLAGQLDQIAPGMPLRLDSMEREVLLLDDLPGLTARSLIQPGDQQGTASITFNTEEKAYDGLILIDNAGSDAIGIWRITGNLTLNNPFGIGDALTVGHTHSEHNLLRNYQLGYQFPIFQDGTRVGVDFSLANFDIGADFKALDIEGESTNLKVSVIHPFIRNRQVNLSGGIALVNQTSETRVKDEKTPGTFDPNLFFLEVSATGSYVHEDQSFSSAFLALSTNFQRNKARDIDGVDNNTLAGRLDMDLSHERAIFPNWSLFGRLVGALSIDPQMDLTQFGIGGPGSVRGFPTSEARGDYGYFTQLEARRFFQINADFVGGLKIFVDHGEVFRKAIPAGSKDSETLTSYGVGANLIYRRNYNLDVQLTMPYRHNGRGSATAFVSDKKKDGRFWLTFSAAI